MTLNSNKHTPVTTRTVPLAVWAMSRGNGSVAQPRRQTEPASPATRLVEQPTQFKSQDPHDGTEHAADDRRETGAHHPRRGAVEDGGKHDPGQQVQRQGL